ncbi:translation elongation factor Tu protein (macronuclear) [Tetrahymena thermophila SB210]|uniref:Translation elongation factor Tu protein n=1 Tax=Tetrahymena thermophila (strain SB210) TaxID=312017 RepID=I7LVS6_TETTS|nr:translation elongation factor Tu protein [Tetrahymena thermophila SB210]EAR99634.1 translation elongation factor Tu protein [Tetrahymena thermophila SB210]|eukprot:XP_001019879.1 translation elongation factor Tu protein [Tetrahymena thermophila SB210]
MQEIGLQKKERITLAVIGNIGSGKSTMCGHLAIQLGQVNDQKLKEVKQACEEEGQDGINYSYIMDTKKVERQRKQSIDTSIFHFETDKFQITIIDTPGDTQYTKNMMTGICLADAAVLMISAAADEFEKGFGKDGQTKDFILHSYALGIKQMIVCINKMDDSKYSFCQKRFNEIKKEVKQQFEKINFNLQNIKFIPISAFLGDNLLEKSPNMPWYNSFTFLQALDNLMPVSRQNEGDLRLPVSYAFLVGEDTQVITGKVEQGILKANRTVCFAPFLGKSENKFDIIQIEIQNKQVEEAFCGENVGFSIKNLNLNDLTKGSICGYTGENQPRECETFDAEMVIINHPGSIKRGYRPMFCIHQAFVACEFIDILSKVERKTAQQISNKPDYIKNGEAAVVRVRPTKPLSVEKFSQCPPLGRFIVRDMNTIVAIGIIKEVVYKQ